MSRVSIRARLAGFRDAVVLATSEGETLYCDLVDDLDFWIEELRVRLPEAGTVVAVQCDFSRSALALFLALAESGHVAVPLTAGAASQQEEMLRCARASVIVEPAPDGSWRWRPGPGGCHPLLDALRARGEAGLVLFSSGSTGGRKTALLSLDRLIARHARRCEALRTLCFLLIDHIGGINTLLFTICGGGTAVVPKARSPDAVCAAVARHRVQLLPTTPTFLNLLLMSGAVERHDLSTLELVTYGTECMPPVTLAAATRALPRARFKQTYGSTELGILPTRSERDGSVWVKAGGDGYELRVVDGMVQVRGGAGMEGYLDAVQPFNDEGWLETGDAVEERGGYLRFLGRKSELISVGGEKLFPIEVEDVLLACPNVADAVVTGRRNAVMGQVVMAQVNLVAPEDEEAAERRLRAYCRQQLAEYKVPAVIQITHSPLHGSRFKRRRQG